MNSRRDPHLGAGQEGSVLYHPGDFIGVPHGIHYILGVAGVADEKEAGNLALKAPVQVSLRVHPHGQDDGVNEKPSFPLADTIGASFSFAIELSNSSSRFLSRIRSF